MQHTPPTQLQPPSAPAPSEPISPEAPGSLGQVGHPSSLPALLPGSAWLCCEDAGASLEPGATTAQPFPSLAL